MGSLPVYLFGSFPFNEFITYKKKKKSLECGVGGWCTCIGMHVSE